jgi:uncharacterized protein
MSLAVKVLACNGKCQSCYENNLRRVNQNRYNFQKVYDTLKREIKGKKENGYYNPVIHGGEPLLLPLQDLRKFLQLIYKEYGQTGVQTNLIKLDKKHIDLFKRYKTHVGISLDGDDEFMNEGRGYDPEPVMENISRLHEAGIPMSIIIILRKFNVCNLTEYETGSKYTYNASLIDFIKRLYENYGIKDFRTNPGIVFDKSLRSGEELTTGMMSNAFRELADFTFDNPGLNIQPFRDIVDLMFGFFNATCNFGQCDPVKTEAEIPINEIGELGNCLKNFGAVDGIETLRADTHGYERYSLLRNLPQKYNGCKDCRYWYICYGGCPGEGIDNDWRNRSRFCEAWKNLFAHVENKLKGLFPNIYTPPDFYPVKVDKQAIFESISESTWQKHKSKNKENIVKNKQVDLVTINGHGDSHGDKHGDAPHGDHTDRGGK